ncbi:22452_t:CDS:2, partial [Entrophospora sp. SA101]
QPKGPYHICGYSFGGLVAWEIAKQLINQGKKVGGVYLIDAPAPLKKLVRPTVNAKEVTKNNEMWEKDIEQLLKDVDLNNNNDDDIDDAQTKELKQTISKLIALMYNYTDDISSNNINIPVHYWRAREYDVLHFSVSTLFGFFGSFNPQLVEQQIKLFPNIKSVEKVSKVKAIAPIQNNGGSTTVSTSFYDLDRIDQRGIKLDGKYTFPTPAGKGVNVYVIDTGINPNVAEFDDRVRFGGSFCTECSEVDDNGHGSAVASVIGGKNFGVAKKVNLIAVKVLNAVG